MEKKNPVVGSLILRKTIHSYRLRPKFSVFKIPGNFLLRTLIRFDICGSCVSSAEAAVTSKHLPFQTGFWGPRYLDHLQFPVGHLLCFLFLGLEENKVTPQ